MSALIHVYQEKWFRHTMRAKSKWLAMVKKAESFDAYVKGIASVTGLPEDVIRASFPAKNWADFQANADKYVEIWMRKIQEAHAKRKWAENYIRAFKTTA